MRWTQCWSNLFFRLFTVGADTTSSGNEFHKFTIWKPRVFARSTDLHILFSAASDCDLVPESETGSGKNNEMLIVYISCRYLYVSITSPRKRRYINDGKSIRLSLSAYRRLCRPGTVFSCSTLYCFNQINIFLSCGCQTTFPYSRCGRTITVYNSVSSDWYPEKWKIF